MSRFGLPDVGDEQAVVTCSMHNAGPDTWQGAVTFRLRVDHQTAREALRTAGATPAGQDSWAYDDTWTLHVLDEDPVVLRADYSGPARDCDTR